MNTRTVRLSLTALRCGCSRSEYMTDKIDSIKHKESKRVSIPSKEEAGYEDASQKVKGGAKMLGLPLNGVITRGKDPELFWMNKYGRDREINDLLKALEEGSYEGSAKQGITALKELITNRSVDNREETLQVDIRSLYRHEHIAPEQLIKNLYRVVENGGPQGDLFSNVNELFGNTLDKDELEKVSDYYSHHDGWTNRLIQGDSHLVMASLLEREGMAGQVQMIYMDPPYGIKYGSNWQIKLNNRDVKDGSDDALTGEPEVIKAFRDTWELGIHSYLSYIRDRLLIAKELLATSGSCFVQISDENVHLVRNVMDEVFGSENFMSQISFSKTSALGGKFLDEVSDYILWYAKDKDSIKDKYRQLYLEKTLGEEGSTQYTWLMNPDGSFRPLTKDEMKDPSTAQSEGRIFAHGDLRSQTGSDTTVFEFEFNGRKIPPPTKGGWKTNRSGIEKLIAANRLIMIGNSIRYVRYLDDFPIYPMNNRWADTGISGFGDAKIYVVQTLRKALARCILMSTDPGDLVLDPTCGSGTTAFVAEQFGRRWITTDTSRIALNIAKTRLMTATFPYYHLYSDNTVEYEAKGNGKLKPNITPNRDQVHDIRQGFVYEKVPHVTLKSLANDEPTDPETLFDKPIEDKKRMRVAGPFTVETLQNFEPVSPEDLAEEAFVHGESFEQVIKTHLLATGIKTGKKEEHVMFSSVETLAGEYLHAEGFYRNGTGEKKAYFHIGPKFGTVSKKAVNEAIKACRAKGDAQWLVILGFSFESDIEGSTQTNSVGTFEVTRTRIHDDLLQEGLKKKPAKSAASFVTIGEPDIRLHDEGDRKVVEIHGLDIYDPIQDVVKPRDVHDIAYWMVDDDYDGSNFVVRQVFFCGGDKDEFAKWKKGLDKIAADATRLRAERTLKIEIDEEAFDRIYGHRSHPIKIKSPGQKIAVRVISQFGEESTKVLST